MKKLLILLIVILINQIQLFAQDNWITKKDKNGYEYKTIANDPLGVQFYTLKNGLTVMLSVNKETPRLQTMIATKAGSKTDPSDHTGLAHYLEHMLFKGTDKYGSLDWEKEKFYLDIIDNLYEKYNSTTDDVARKQIYKEIDSVSGYAAKYAIANEYDKMMSLIGAKGTNAFTSFEKTCYVNDIPTNQFDRWLTIESERFRNPVLRLFHTELEAVYEEKNRSLDNDGRKVNELMFSKLFTKHNYGLQTTIGTVEHLKNPSLKEIRNYFYKNYVPNNMCMILAGDVNPEDAIVKIDKAFGNMQPKPVPEYTFEKEAAITAPIEATVVGPDAEYVNLAFRFPGANSKEAMMLNFMSQVLSNGNAGLMDLNLVKKQKVLSAGAGAYTLKDYSILFLSGKALKGQKLEDVKQLMLDQIELLKSGSFDNEILTAIINNYKKSLIEQRESNNGRAYSLLESFTTDVDWSQQVNELNEMSKITKADIQQFCKQWMNNNYVCIYKKSGKDDNIKKVEKPTITPVSVNREAQSDFVKMISNTTVNPIAPVFVNYDKDIARTTVKTKTNSVPMLSVKNKINNLFSQYYYVEAGSLNNKLFPIAMDYLQYLGTDKYSAEEISKKFYTLACDFGVNVANEESYVYLNGLQENYKPAVELFEHLLANCKADEEALKNWVAAEKKKRSDSKLNKNYIRMGLRNYAQYGSRNPFNNELSNAELDNLKADDLIKILHSLTSYNHKVLYYGPLENTAISKELGTLHVLPKTFLATPKADKYRFTTQNNSEVLFADYDMVQAEIQWFRNGDTYNPEMVPTINLFNEYFGGSMSGIVFQEIRESKALAYSTSASYGSPAKKEEPFFMSAYVGCQSDKMKEAIPAMQELLTNLPKSEKSFSQSIAAIKNQISTSRTIKTSILFSYLNAQKKGLNYDMSEKVYNTIDKLSFTDIQQFHKNNVAQKPYVLCVLGSDKKVNWEELKKFGTIKKLTLEELFGY